MLQYENMRSPIKILLSVMLVMIFLYGIGMAVYKSNSVITYDVKWLTPFESLTTTVYDLGDGHTSTVSTSTVTTVTSVKHSDQRMFSEEQWYTIIREIECGNIVWED